MKREYNYFVCFQAIKGNEKITGHRVVTLDRKAKGRYGFSQIVFQSERQTGCENIVLLNIIRLRKHRDSFA